MAINVSDSGSGKDFELAPAGNHTAVCYQVIDLGVQETSFGDKHKIRISWELVDETMDDGRRFSVSKEYTASLNEKANLRQDLDSWRGRPFTEDELKAFDVSKVAGVPAMVNVVHKGTEGGKTYANVVSVSGLPKGMPKPTAENDLLVFELDNPHNFGDLPEWLQKRIKIEDTGGPDAGDFPDDSIGF